MKPRFHKEVNKKIKKWSFDLKCSLFQMVCLVKVTEDWNQVTPVEFVARCSTEQVCSEKQVCCFQKFLGAPTQYLGTCISFLGSFLTTLLDITFT